MLACPPSRSSEGDARFATARNPSWRTAPYTCQAPPKIPVSFLPPPNDELYSRNGGACRARNAGCQGLTVRQPYCGTVGTCQRSQLRREISLLGVECTGRRCAQETREFLFVHIDRPMSSRDEWQRGAERVSASIAQVSENAVSRRLVAVRVAQWSLFPALSRVPQAKSLGVAPCAVE